MAQFRGGTADDLTVSAGQATAAIGSGRFVAVDWDDAARYDGRAAAVSAVGWALAPGPDRPPIARRDKEDPHGPAGSMGDELAILTQAGWLDRRPASASEWSGRRVVPVTLTLAPPPHAGSGLRRGSASAPGRLRGPPPLCLPYPALGTPVPLDPRAPGFGTPEISTAGGSDGAPGSSTGADGGGDGGAPLLAAASAGQDDDAAPEARRVGPSPPPSSFATPPAHMAAAWASVLVQRHSSVARALALLRVREGEAAAEAGSSSASDTRPLGATTAARHGRVIRPLTLAKCLDAFTGAGSLDGWKCSRCGGVGAWRTSSVWRQPDILVVHLLRFEQQTVPPFRRVKINSLVDFPVDGFSVGPWLSGPAGGADPTGGSDGAAVDRAATSAATAALGGAVSPARPPTASGSATTTAPSRHPSLRRELPSDRRSFTYDLCGVVNHSGGLGSGHYTAYARLPRGGAPPERLAEATGPAARPAWAGDWAHFNDHSVRVGIDPSEIVSNRAYLLFYRKRSLTPRNLVALGARG